jgi:hypothetical protein
MRRLARAVLLGILATSAQAQTPGPAAKPGSPPVSPSSPPAAPAKEPPAAQPTENLRPFDPHEVRLAWNNRRWQLVHRGEVLKDFGGNDQEARQALRLIQELHLNQHATLGAPQPVLEYWLSDGKPPRGGGHRGLRTVPLDPASLRVEQVEGQWILRDTTRVFFNFNQGADEARQALAVLRKYHFDQIGVVGHLNPMYVPLAAAHAESPALSNSPRHLLTPPFSRAARNAEAGKSPAQAEASGWRQPPVPTPQQAANVPRPSPVVAGLLNPAVPPLPGPDKPRQPAWQTRPVAPEAPPAPPASERIAFDWRQARLRQHDGQWKLMAGATVLGNFGQQVQEGQRALAALRYYRFTEQVRLGGPEPYLTYYVANRTTPLGVMFGLQGERVQPDKVELRHSDVGYAIYEGQRVLFRLRDREDEARKLLETIKAEKCDRVCRIGEPGKEPMTLLLRTEHPVRGEGP